MQALSFVIDYAKHSKLIEQQTLTIIYNYSNEYIQLKGKNITNRTKTLTNICSCQFSYSSSIPSLMSLDLSSLFAQQQKQQQPSTSPQQTLSTIPSPSQPLPINGQLFY